MHAPTPDQHNRLAKEIDDRALARLRAEEGRRHLQVTTTDPHVLRALMACQNSQTGRCDPGLRALADRAGVSRGAAADSTHRLRRLRAIGWSLKLKYVHGSLRFCRAYWIAAEPEELRPRFAPKGASIERSSGGERPVDKPPLPAPPLRSVAQQLRLAADLTPTRRETPEERAARIDRACAEAARRRRLGLPALE